ncbi:MAG: NAD-dependent deacylase [Saprospiraceae bacterium]|nr:NAD-dependent deacylase [Saprospiraceae bacterium]
MQKVVILTGAGISAESGIKTFRDSDGLWEGHDINIVASPDGWHKYPKIVLDFYNQRRKQLKEVNPNLAHLALKRLEEKYEVVIITQNVDDLHERAGSSKIIHLHGQLNKVKCSVESHKLIYSWTDDLDLGDLCDEGHQLRPHIVWFGESVPMMDIAIQHCMSADILIIIGTSMQVYPAAGLVSYAPDDCEMYYIDPNPKSSYEFQRKLKPTIIKKTATEGVTELVDSLLDMTI